MSRGAQWALFGASVPGALALYLLLMLVTGKNDQLVILELFWLYGGLGAFGLTGLALLWGTVPGARPRFPLLGLVLLLPVLAVRRLRESTNLVRTAAINGVIWAVLIALFLLGRWVRDQDRMARSRYEDRIRAAESWASGFGLTHDRAERCQAVLDTWEAVKRERPDVRRPHRPTMCDPEAISVEAQIVAAGSDPAKCPAALAARNELYRRRKLYIDDGKCPRTPSP
jgi:hypothetical protein